MIILIVMVGDNKLGGGLDESTTVMVGSGDNKTGRK